MQQQDIHVFQGMRRDNHPIRQDTKFLWEAINIRLTNINGDNSLMSVTNEKGTKATNVNLTGNYVGHCIIGEYLVVFTRDTTNNIDYIYRISKNDTNQYISEVIYKGTKINLNPQHILQTISSYESNYVQKIYWTDGVTSPKVINVVADKLYDKDLSKIKNYDSLYHNFDFVPELILQETVEVNRLNNNGEFSPGTIQYAFSYYNKYGQESNIFYTTELLYISYNDRGGSPEDKVSNTFGIKITKTDSNFEYLRIYSIHRTSLNATPTVKVVSDIPINGGDYYFEDTGREGYNIDPTTLLYIGGEDIVASTMVSKDNTLFLGNIKINRPYIPSTIKSSLKTIMSNYTSTNISVSERTIANDKIESFYSYDNQLKYGNTSTFKVNDTYRLGLQCQYKNGKWSEPLWLKDYTIPSTIKPHYKDNNLVLPEIVFDLKNIENTNYKIITELSSLGYKKIRPLIVMPTLHDRSIIAQGILCPTVFSVKDRVNNSPFVQSSWFFRPMMIDSQFDNTKDIDKGSLISYRPYAALLGGSDRGAEIQDMEIRDFSTANAAAIAKEKVPNTFFVDQSILTFHSPDIEFDDSTKLALDNNNYDLYIVGLVPFKSVAGDISIQTSSAVPSPNDTGFYHRTILSNDYSNRGLIAGMFYKSHVIDDDDNATKYQASKYDNDNYEYNWLVYPWHRTGSLNNDIVRPSDKGTRTSVLKRKVISNIRFSEDNDWLDTAWSPNYGITKTSIFDSDEMSLNKIDIPKNTNIDAINYYGNIDTLVTTNDKYDLYLIGNPGVAALDKQVKVTNAFTHYPLKSVKESANGYIPDNIGNGDSGLQQSKEPVRLKYKSTPHAIFALNNVYNTTIVLPKLSINNNTINSLAVDKSSLFWLKQQETESAPSSATSVPYSNVVVREGNNDQIISDCYSYLSNKYPQPDDTHRKALMTSLLYPKNTDYADLWICNVKAGVSGNSYVWTNYELSVYNGDNYYSFTDEYNNITYWKKIQVGETWVLKRMITSNDVSIKQDTITFNGKHSSALLYLAELRRKTTPTNRFGGDTDEALRNNLWLPAGKPVDLKADNKVLFTYGDTYYQRYDCLKTYPFTTEDENSVVDIASFMCETRVNIDGRYDKNRGQTNNLNISPLNFNLYNEVYNQRDNFFNYRILEDNYYRNTYYPSQVVWSTQKSALEDIDSWTNVTLASSIDLNGDAGKVTSLNVFNESLIAFQEKAMNLVLFNSRVQIQASDGVPIEIANNNKVEGTRVISDSIGCATFNETINSPLGLYFIDNNTKTLYLYNGQINNISDKLGCKWWFSNISTNIYSPFNNEGVKLNYDSINQDLHICDLTNTYSLCYSEKLGQFTSLMPYNFSIFANIKDESLSLYTFNNNEVSLWLNFQGDYNEFYGSIKLPSLTYICNDNSTYTKIFDTLEYRADIYDNNGKLINNKSFDWIKAYNEYQNSGICNLNQSRRIYNDVSLRKKFRVWRSQIPRQGRERIRNPWAAISLGFTNHLNNVEEDKFKLVLHDISTRYTI